MRAGVFASFALLMAFATAQAQQTPASTGAATGIPTPPPPTIAPLPAPPGIPEGIWLLPLNAAVQIFDCQGRLCGRIVWLAHARSADGQLALDKRNPDETLRQRPLCGQTVLWGLKPEGVDHWTDGWLYNPHDGNTYRVKGEFRGPDTLVARIYRGIPLFGETLTWRRVPRLSSEGWC
ncbi:MAG TPA: DUF2147 domain-containing protein [Caulobacteraceae bacterium]|nr:DUF2147 domain-containing protein [Caulobacteraceae bacterium]